MIKNRTLKYLFLVILSAAVASPLIVLYFTFPLFTNLLVISTEDEAQRLASHLSKSIAFSDEGPSLESLQAWFEAEGEEVKRAFKLKKIKAISPSGEVVFSSDAEDVGHKYNNQHFKKIVATGESFAKLMEQKLPGIGGESVEYALVEAYVPILLNGKFLGGFNLYYDITERRDKIKGVLFYAGIVPLVLASVFSIIISLGTAQLDKSMAKQDAANKRLLDQQKILVDQNETLNTLLDRIARSKQEWMATTDRIQEMVILVDDQGLIAKTNNAAREFTGLNYPEIIGAELETILDHCGISPANPSGEGREIYHAESGKWFLIRQYPFNLNDNGPSIGNVVTLSDITALKLITKELEQKNAELGLRKAKLQEALDELSTTIKQVSIDEDFTSRLPLRQPAPCYELMECGHESCPCFGKGPSRCWQVAGTYCRGSVSGVFAAQLEDCTECEVYLSAAFEPVSRIGEEFNNMMHILESKNHELQRAYEELQLAQDRILQQEKMASLGRIASGAAHEINNPMEFVRKNLKVMEEYAGNLFEFIELQSQTLREANALERLSGDKERLEIDFIKNDLHNLIEESLDGAQRVSSIVRGLHGFSRLGELEFKEIDLNESIDGAVKVLWRTLKDRCKVRKNYGTLPPIRCFLQQINQVFVNLIDNAVQAMEGEGEIKIRTWTEDGAVFASIEDNGCGIPEENMSKIFEPFFTTRETGQGPGLGLGVVYDILQSHGGSISVESQVGNGSKFILRLPLSPRSRAIQYLSTPERPRFFS